MCFDFIVKQSKRGLIVIIDEFSYLIKKGVLLENFRQLLMKFFLKKKYCLSSLALLLE